MMRIGVDIITARPLGPPAAPSRVAGRAVPTTAAGPKRTQERRRAAVWLLIPIYRAGPRGAPLAVPTLIRAQTTLE
jgi:hypothetical protein